MNRIPYVLMAGRAKENLPGGSLKYLFVYLKIRIFKCSYRICNSICLLTMNCQAVLLELLCQAFFFLHLAAVFPAIASLQFILENWLYLRIFGARLIAQGISGDLRGSQGLPLLGLSQKKTGFLHVINAGFFCSSSPSVEVIKPFRAVGRGCRGLKSNISGVWSVPWPKEWNGVFCFRDGHFRLTIWFHFCAAVLTQTTQRLKVIYVYLCNKAHLLHSGSDWCNTASSSGVWCRGGWCDCARGVPWERSGCSNQMSDVSLLSLCNDKT